MRLLTLATLLISEGAFSVVVPLYSQCSQQASCLVASVELRNPARRLTGTYSEDDIHRDTIVSLPALEYSVCITWNASRAGCGERPIVLCTGDSNSGAHSDDDPNTNDGHHLDSDMVAWRRCFTGKPGDVVSFVVEGGASKAVPDTRSGNKGESGRFDVDDIHSTCMPQDPLTPVTCGGSRVSGSLWTLYLPGCPSLKIKNALPSSWIDGAINGTFHTVQCKPGYVPGHDGAVQRAYCTSNSNWELPLPTCTLPRPPYKARTVPLQNPDVPVHCRTLYVASADTNFYGPEAVWNCSNGLVPHGAAVCGTNAPSWTIPEGAKNMPECISSLSGPSMNLKFCPRVDIWGSKSGSIVAGQETYVYVECTNGNFTLDLKNKSLPSPYGDDPHWAYCDSNGQWAKPLPACILKTPCTACLDPIAREAIAAYNLRYQPLATLEDASIHYEDDQEGDANATIDLSNIWKSRAAAIGVASVTTPSPAPPLTAPCLEIDIKINYPGITTNEVQWKMDGRCASSSGNALPLPNWQHSNVGCCAVANVYTFTLAPFVNLTRSMPRGELWVQYRDVRIQTSVQSYLMPISMEDSTEFIVRGSVPATLPVICPANVVANSGPTAIVPCVDIIIDVIINRLTLTQSQMHSWSIANACPPVQVGNCEMTPAYRSYSIHACLSPSATPYLLNTDSTDLVYTVALKDYSQILLAPTRPLKSAGIVNALPFDVPVASACPPQPPTSGCETVQVKVSFRTTDPEEQGEFYWAIGDYVDGCNSMKQITPGPQTRSICLPQGLYWFTATVIAPHDWSESSIVFQLSCGTNIFLNGARTNPTMGTIYRAEFTINPGCSGIQGSVVEYYSGPTIGTPAAVIDFATEEESQKWWVGVTIGATLGVVALLVAFAFWQWRAHQKSAECLESQLHIDVISETTIQATPNDTPMHPNC